ncbi:MAG: hypothetical protein K6A28_09065 [Bacteroidales bacterium]|nr:hypothetical protein [Bacteroidales bacterium]
MRKLAILIAVVLLLPAMGCRDYFPESDRVVVAECYGHRLYADELAGVVPDDATRMDSLSRINAFVDSWIRRQLLIYQAEKNLTPEQRDFSKQLEDYRNSLIIYAYETQLIQQYLDTVVTDEEIEEYYEQNKQNFQLRATMVKVAYVILKDDCKQQKEFQHLMSDPDTLMLPKLDVLAGQYAKSSFLDVDSWVRLDDFLSLVPLKVYDAESFLRKNHFVKMEIDDLIYMVRFEDYLMEESISPIEMESDNIKNIILLKRQKNLLSQMNSDLYEKAEKENAFEIY